MRELELVRQFHIKYSIPIVENAHLVPRERIKLRIDLIKEEVKELVEAHEAGNRQHIAKEACDVLYVILGCALEFGYQDYFEGWEMFSTEMLPGREESLVGLRQYTDKFAANWAARNLTETLYYLEEYLYFSDFSDCFGACLNEVHRSNMSKGTNGVPIFRDDGKLLKGADFSPANLSFLS